MSPRVAVPTFAVIGAARAGTTAITEALRSHPDVFVTSPKEPHYFAFAGARLDFRGPGDATGINAVAVTDRDSYLSLYPSTQRFRALGEGSVSSLYYHDRSIPAMLELNPQMRVVVALRDPVERAYSSYQYLRLRGLEPEPSFLVAVELEPARIAANWHHLWHYTAMSRYAEALRHFQSAFGARVGVWLYDDLKATPNTVLEQIYCFLDLPIESLPPPTLPHVNASGRPRVAAVQSLVRRAAQNERLVPIVRRAVPYRLREKLRTANLKTDAMPASARTQLAPLFADDLAAVSALLGRALPWR